MYNHSNREATARVGRAINPDETFIVRFNEDEIVGESTVLETHCNSSGDSRDASGLL